MASNIQKKTPQIVSAATGVTDGRTRVAASVYGVLDTELYSTNTLDAAATITHGTH